MATRAPPGPRADFFQQLKQVCVPLSRLAILSQGEKEAADPKQVLSHVESLTSLWSNQASGDASVLDDKLADYVFFPLSHLLRSQDKYPMRVIEAIIRLLRSLIEHGWKTKTSTELFSQLLLFFSLTVGSAPGQPTRQLPEETLVEGYRALAALITVTNPSHFTVEAKGASPSFEENEVLPALGHSITVMLDGVTGGVAPQVQLEALSSLKAVFVKIHNISILAHFLPGTVSTLSKLLSPPMQAQMQKRVLVNALDLLKLVLISCLADIKVRPLLKQLEAMTKQEEQPAVQNQSPGSRIELTPAWLRGTASQVKLALSAVLKLRNHESRGIQASLYKLCIALLDECHASLSECQSVLVESALMLQDEEATKSRLETSLQDLASIYPELGDSIKSALYNWITALPRVMQSSDERSKQLAIRNILRGSKLAAEMRMDSSTLDDALGDSLRDSIITLVKSSKPSKVVDHVITESALLAAGNTSLVGPQIEELATFAPVLLDLESQKTTRAELKSLISNIGSAAQQIKLATAMLGHIRDSDGVDQIASYWLAFELLKSTYAQSSDMDQLFDFSPLGDSQQQEQAFQELYDFSASVLVAHSDTADADWRLEAIALEVTAFAASRAKVAFRPELIDVLYPVTTFLGSPVPQLRSHAITTLNALAAYCEYGSVSELIVDNADYMVNSVSLRLNTFDISPASTQVLTMLVRLTGPRLVPFLDDVVAAVFGALDNYHGYPAFVESLFSVLSEVVTQGAKSDALLLEGPPSTRVDHRKKSSSFPGAEDVLAALDKRAERAKQSREEEEEEAHAVKHPKKPWGDDKSEAKSLLDALDPPQPSDDDNNDDGENKDSDNQLSAPEEEKKPPTPAYTLLSRVLSLTQHHLTSPSPSLRKSLLEMIATVGPALSPDENSFLPLVNAVWPVAAARLRDAETYVAVAACRALSSLCESAGDFLSTRFNDLWWGASGRDGLGAWARRAKREAEGIRSGSGPGGRAIVSQRTGGEGILVPGLHDPTMSAGEKHLVLSSQSSKSELGQPSRFTQAAQLWEAILGLLEALVTYVRVEDEMMDEILELVADSLGKRRALREALEVVNSDAVWLVMYERGMVGWRPAPVVEGFRFAQMRRM